MMIGIPEKSATGSGDQRIRLGRIVAASKGGLVFISTTESLNASSFIAHSDDRLKRTSHCPLRLIRRARIQIGLRARPIGDPAIGGRRRGRPLRSTHRQFIRPVARQLVRPWRLAGVSLRRRHLRPRTTRRAFLRRLGRLTRLDRRILLRIDRRFAHPQTTARRRQCSFSFEPSPIAYCSGSWLSRRSPARACRRCSPPAIRSATNVRSPPRGATMMAALA